MHQSTEEIARKAATIYRELKQADLAAKLQRLYEADIRSRGPLAAIDWYVASAA